MVALILACRLPPADVAQPLDIVTWRALAEEAGDGPTTLQFIEVTAGPAPAVAAAPAGPFEMAEFVFGPTVATWPDGHTLVVDAMSDAKGTSEAMPWIDVPAEATARQDALLLSARRIVATHEHFDHVGGLFHSASFDGFADRLSLTAAQVANLPELRRSGLRDDQIASLRPLPLSSPAAIDGGVVLIPSPGHTPGHLWVYVRLADGRETLLVGDTCWQPGAIATGQGRPRALQWAMSEDGEAVRAQLASLRALQDSAPDLAIACAHDAVAMRALAP